MEIKIGENIKRLRKAKNVTQEQIAEVLGISVTAVSKWERCETYPDITLLFPLAHYFEVTLDELMGYDEEPVRLNAWNMKAKLLHAEGKTEEALVIYREKYPNWYDTRDQKAEQLFGKDTPEFMQYLKQNLYELTDFATDKKMKDIWFCAEDSVSDKVKHSLVLAEALGDMRSKTGDEALLIAEYVVYTCLWGYVQRFGFTDEGKVNEIGEKRKAAAVACNRLAEQDAYVKAYLLKRYGCENLL